MKIKLLILLIVLINFIWYIKKYIKLLSEGTSIMMREKEKIDLITQISLDINEVKDIDLLLEKILTSVRTFFNADAGSIYLKEGDELKFSHSQNNTLQKKVK